VYRPFPVEELREALTGVEAAAVLEKEVSLGYQGGLVTDLKSSLYNTDIRPDIRGYVMGLAGRDIRKQEIRNIAEEMEELVADPVSGPVSFEDEQYWPQLKDELLSTEVPL
jgi:pyruvate ferredoxin oxidoreductase alpha subunit